jgi:hypothetical protein
MKLAEELYQAGYLSYPRTETDAFDPGMDLLVGAWGLSGWGEGAGRLWVGLSGRLGRGSQRDWLLDRGRSHVHPLSSPARPPPQSIVREHTQDGRWGGHAAAIAAGTMWKPPRPGGRLGGGSGGGAGQGLQPQCGTCSRLFTHRAAPPSPSQAGTTTRRTRQSTPRATAPASPAGRQVR